MKRSEMIQKLHKKLDDIWGYDNYLEYEQLDHILKCLEELGMVPSRPFMIEYASQKEYERLKSYAESFAWDKEDTETKAVVINDDDSDNYCGAV